MEMNFTRSITIVLALGAALGGCRPKQPAGQVTTGPETPTPIIPAGYQKIAPGPADDSTGMLRQTAVVFRGVVKDIQFTFDNCGGPRTKYVFGDSSALLGALPAGDISLKVLGGPTPSGRWVNVSELPRLALNAQYVTFLRNTDWTYSPIVNKLVFRVETIAGREVLVDPTGRAVTGWSDEGPVLSAAVVSEAVGAQRRGYRSADAGVTGAPTRGDAPGLVGQVVQVRPGTERPPASAAPGQDAPLARAPSLADIEHGGFFTKPAVRAESIGNERPVSVENLVSEIRAAASRANVQVGGRVALDPYWKCWSSTPTASAKR